VGAIAPTGETTTMEYDRFSRVTQVTDANQHATQYGYNNVGELTSITLPDGAKTRYRYDNLGRLIAVEDANGHVTQHRYDAFDRPVLATLPLGQQASMRYNGLGQMTGYTDFNGDMLNYAYDQYGRLQQRSFSDTRIPSVSYGYDPITSQVVSVTDSRGVTGYQYDQRDRLQKITRPDGQTVGYGYDLLDNVTSVATAASTVNYGYDPLNRLDTVTVGTQKLADYDYDAASRVVKTTLGDGTVEQATYDQRDRLTGLSTSLPAQTQALPGYTYTLDAVGNRVKVQEAAGRLVEYTYDTQDRLIQEVVTESDGRKRTITYAYDAVGNQLTRADSATQSTAYNYDANDRLTTATTGSTVESFRYDNNGSLLERSTGADRTTYDWRNEGENRLTQVTVQEPNQTSTVEYRYDASGNRVSRIENGVQTNYLSAPMMGLSQVLMEYDPSGQVLADYTYGLGLVRSRQGNTQQFFHSDGLGSTRQLTNPTGQVTDSYNFDAYGQLLSRTGNANNPYLFAGQQRDFTTNLDYLRARYYAPDLGRFISTDAFPGFIERPISQHSYLYANGNPVNFTDPTGYNTFQDVMVTAAFTSILASFGWSGAIVGAQYLSGAPPTPEELLIYFDQWVAGFAHVVTLGLSTQFREATAGPWATRNHQGALWNLGFIAGLGSSLFLSVVRSGPIVLRFNVAGFQWEYRLYNAYMTAAGAYQLGRKAIAGELEFKDSAYLAEFLPSGAAQQGAKFFISVSRAARDRSFRELTKMMVGARAEGFGPTTGAVGGGAPTGPTPPIPPNRPLSPKPQNNPVPAPGTGTGAPTPPPATPPQTTPMAPSPQTPVGRRTSIGNTGSDAPRSNGAGRQSPQTVNSPLQPFQNQGGTVNGQEYSGHAFDQMRNRGLVPSVVENTIQNGIKSPGNTPSTTLIYDPINDVTVIINSTGKVITTY
jgi:large repetitive protein